MSFFTELMLIGSAVIGLTVLLITQASAWIALTVLGCVVLLIIGITLLAKKFREHVMYESFPKPASIEERIITPSNESSPTHTLSV